MHGVEIFVRDQNSPEAELGARHLLQYNQLFDYAWIAALLNGCLECYLCRSAERQVQNRMHKLVSDRRSASSGLCMSIENR